ncbi:hypothetical protein IC582_016821 [Cucumis melo]|uniref:Uncharacterized protein LOC103493030 n=2 Tax=Cucumis melo TaxID=3656 RepID=A0A1S3BTB0_CUCME|nr:uncharacterized protein LOC103493030 isoform X2 [Cucumis melo]KAA0040183.1 uncharacterized protein E6C27_scaffold118G00190 [Cucumis melo var. makuwa]TYK16453.1 uncharacterized protein E5676_scaffold21G002510 [Cucumis melo var. makuwa]
MGKKHEIDTPVTSRQIDLKKSFKLAVRSLLTSCSREEFRECFSRFTTAEQDYLHRLFIQVITSLHGNIEDEFESLCVETQVGLVLDNVEQLLEEQDLDPLYSKKTNIVEISNFLSMKKMEEIQHLKDMLKTAEEQNRVIQGRIDVLRKGVQDASGMADAVKKLRSECRSYGTDGVNETLDILN